MKRLRIRGAWPLLAVATLTQTAAGEQPSPTRAWSFESEKAGAAPAGFSLTKSEAGKPGRWVVKKESGAASGHQVLAQLDADDTDDRFLMAVADAPSLKDLRVSVRCKAVSGKVDQACGLVFRYRDPKNYYVTRSNALEGNVRLYFVKDGRRKQLASWSGKVTGNAWHELRAEAHGDHLRVFWNGAKILEARDGTFGEAGQIGLWTKADSVTYFDDLSITPLASP